MIKSFEKICYSYLYFGLTGTTKKRKTKKENEKKSISVCACASEVWQLYDIIIKQDDIADDDEHSFNTRACLLPHTHTETHRELGCGLATPQSYCILN